MTEHSPNLFATLQESLGSSYAIERELGGGGMSRVFLARETALGRKVVIKVLPPELAASVNADRFKREIQMAAQLQHSCIVPVLATGTAAGLPYYTMPFVEGESLRAKLDREGELPLPEVVRYMRDMLEALSHAHEHGLVHRDIKPENVLLSKHHALVADFGVAKALSASTNAGADSLTSLGVALGTPAYMAPEQAAADPAVDSRADLYAVGAVGYEMLTGQKLFSARSPAAMLAAQATENPEPVETRRPHTPPILAALVTRLLEKRPADRPRTADEALRDLESMSTPTAGLAPTTAIAARRPVGAWLTRRTIVSAVIVASAAGLFASWAATRGGDAPAVASEAPRSIAVLPFANIGGAPDNEYLSDGISEELIGALSRVEGLQVAARSSSFSFKGKNEDVRAVGSKLGVATVLGGSVQRAGNRIRVAAQLTDVRSGYILWSDSYDREMRDVFALQDDLSRAIVGALSVQFASRGAVGSATRATTNPEAYEAYLRARYHWNRRTLTDIEQATTHLERAIALDSGFALAYAGLADVDLIRASWGWEPRSTAYPRAIQRARRAVVLAPSSAEASATLGAALCNSRTDFQAARAAFRRAIALNPDLGAAHYWHAVCLADFMYGPEAILAAQRAIELEPLNRQFVTALGRAHMAAGEPAKAVEVLTASLRLEPDLSSTHGVLALAHAATGNFDATIREADLATDLVGWDETMRAYVAAKRGNREPALRALGSPTTPNRLVAEALLYSALGERDRAVRVFIAAIEQGAEGATLAGLIERETFDDPRVLETRRRLGMR